MLNRKNRAEKIQMKKTLKAREERDVKQASTSDAPEQALPAYLLDREGQKDAKALSAAVKERRKDKAARYAVPLPQVRGLAEDETFKVVKTGKRKSKGWKRMVTKATFVGESFTRKPPKLERFIRPMGLRYRKAHITHREYRIAVGRGEAYRSVRKEILGSVDEAANRGWCSAALLRLEGAIVLLSCESAIICRTGRPRCCAPRAAAPARSAIRLRTR